MNTWLIMQIGMAVLLAAAFALYLIRGRNRDERNAQENPPESFQEGSQDGKPEDSQEE